MHRVYKQEPGKVSKDLFIQYSTATHNNPFESRAKESFNIQFIPGIKMVRKSKIDPHSMTFL